MNTNVPKEKSTKNTKILRNYSEHGKTVLLTGPFPLN